MPAHAKLALTLLSVAVFSASALTAGAQTAAPKEALPITALFNRNLIYIDPAHGGQDAGAHLTNQLQEKDVTLSLALKLKEALSAKGFTVVLARQTDDPGAALATLDDRAGLANRVRPVACILLHATPASHGAHLYVSSLNPPVAELHALPWDTAQASWVPQSQRLAAELGSALVRSHIPTLIHRADPKPLSNLTCPAVALEIAPLLTDGATTPVNDPGYQQHIADSVANALVFWKGHADPRPDPNAPAVKAPEPAPKSAPAAAPSVAPKPKPAPKPVPVTPPAPAKSDADPEAKPASLHPLPTIRTEQTL